MLDVPCCTSSDTCRRTDICRAIDFLYFSKYFVTYLNKNNNERKELKCDL